MIRPHPFKANAMRGHDTASWMVRLEYTAFLIWSRSLMQCTGMQWSSAGLDHPQGLPAAEIPAAASISVGRHRPVSGRWRTFNDWRWRIETKKGPLARDPFSISLARPERFELPTFWFVGGKAGTRFLFSQSLAALAIHHTYFIKAQLRHIQPRTRTNLTRQLGRPCSAAKFGPYASLTNGHS